MSAVDTQAVLDRVYGESAKGAKNGTRVYLHYRAFGKPTPRAIQDAARASDLGIPRDRYTGRVHRVWTSRVGDRCLTMWVELERNHMFRTFNLDRGEVYRFVVLGD
jgi:hypothetical protein